ncbi:MAG: VOC family protein [Planctomycetes bacterium]|nr:VOC family protein [Planctomycetota bacterium]MCW8135878.1 VOC family protein [Planctomycetota bacterium]
MKTRIHISVPVSDLEASKAFYTRLFGAQPTKAKPDYANWRLDQPALHLALVQAPHAVEKKNQVRHFGVELFDNGDLGDWRKRAEQAGMQLRIEEQVTCCYAVADKFWAQDPDGNEWEFWVRSEEAEAMHAGREAKEGECCAPLAKAEPAMAGAAASPCCTPTQKAEAIAANKGCCG